MRSFYLMFVALLFLNLKCKKEADPAASDTDLPAITQDGKNTFGCKVNGEIWLPSTTYKTGVQNLCVSLGTGGGFSLYVTHDHAGSANKGGDFVNIILANLTATGVYQLTDSNLAYVRMAIETDYYPGDTYTVTQGTLTITRFDMVNKIVSGQFAFAATNRRLGTKFNVTDGRFDLRSDYCR